MARGSRITDVTEVPDDTTYLFRVRDRDSGETREAFLVRADGANGRGEIQGWLNECQHFTHIMIDKGSGAEMRNGEVICTNHGAMFSADTGRCTYGPCEGAVLEDVAVTVEDGAVYLDDPAFEFVAVGAETDDLDLTSTSNVEF